MSGDGGRGDGGRGECERRFGVWLLWPMEGRVYDDNSGLTRQERGRHDRLRNAGRRRLFAASRTAVRAMLRAARGGSGDWQCPPGGRPRTRGAALSVSHCGDVTAVAIGPPQTPIGVDVEQLRTLPESLTRQLLTPAERRDGSPEERSAVAIRRWVTREATFKATGDACDSGAEVRIVDLPGRGVMAAAWTPPAASVRGRVLTDASAIAEVGLYVRSLT